MADRRFNIQSETRGVNTTKTNPTTNSLREDTQPSPIINGTKSVTIPERRPSQVYLRRLSMSMSASRKDSMAPVSTAPRPNTYRMEPDNDYRFCPYKIQARILEVLVEQMKDQTYNSSTINELLRTISNSIHYLVKNFQLPRYKIIIQTVIGQKLNQLLLFSSRCLWDTKTDNMLTVNYETKDMVAMVTVYAVYLD